MSRFLVYLKFSIPFKHCVGPTLYFNMIGTIRYLVAIDIVRPLNSQICEFIL